VSQRAVLAARQGSQDRIKHTIKILRTGFSKKSQHNPGSTLVSSAPNLWAVDCGKSCASMRAGEQPSSRPLHVDTFTYVCQRGCIGIGLVNGDYAPATSSGLALTFSREARRRIHIAAASATESIREYVLG